MEPTTATDVCDGIFKSKNITVHGNATIIEQTGPKFVYSVEQQKSLELMTILEEKCPIVQRDGQKSMIGEKASHSRLNYQATKLKAERKSDALTGFDDQLNAPASAFSTWLQRPAPAPAPFQC